MRTRARLALAAVLTVSLAMHAWDLAVPGLLDRTGRLKGQDFLQFYTYGTLVRNGDAHSLYRPAAHASIARLRVSPALALSDFHPNYSPFIAALMAPLAGLPFLDALALWTAIAVVLYAGAVALLATLTARLASDRVTLALAAAAWPALFMTLRYGQISTLSLLLLASAACLDARRHPFAAGALVGFLAYKPTLVAVPALALLAAGQWTMIAGMVAAAGLETGLAIAVAGLPAFTEYLGGLVSLAAAPDLVQLFPTESHSIRGFVRLIAPYPHLATAAFIAGSAAAVAAAAYVWRKESDWRTKWAALTLATLAGSPHVLTYDLVLLAVPLVLLTDWWIEHGRARTLGPWTSTLLLLYAAAWPGVMIARIYRVQISTIGMVMAVWLLVRHASAQRLTAEEETVTHLMPLP